MFIWTIQIVTKNTFPEKASIFTHEECVSRVLRLISFFLSPGSKCIQKHNFIHLVSPRVLAWGLEYPRGHVLVNKLM